MAFLNNHVSLAAARGLFSITSKNRTLGHDRWPQTRDGVLLACVHLSHYDPFAIGVLLRRPVAWMARIESFATPWTDWLTRSCGGFPIDRFGFALPGIREGIQRVRRGELVGIFPEGEVMSGDRSVLNGAPMKEGVGLIARRTGAPVVPCIVINSSQFSNVVPWLPFKAGDLWLGVGEPLRADPDLPPGRASRAELTRRLEHAFRDLHREMVDTFEIPSHHAP